MGITKIRVMTLALLCVSSLMWSTLHAATRIVTIDDINYKIDSMTGEATCTGPTSKNLKKNNVVIMDKVTYLDIVFPVTTIEDYAFRLCTRLTGSLTIPNSVTKIGRSAFAGCSGFTGSLTIPNSVTSIGDVAFSGCSGFTGSLTIPNSVKYIDYYTFSDCSGLTGSLTISNSVTKIKLSAFAGCSGFTGSLTIPNSVTKIENYAFEGCNGLTGVIIGKNVRELGCEVFSRCDNLKWVKCLATKPPVTHRDFEPNFSNYDIPLYVPEESIKAYCNAACWRDFIKILALDNADR